MRKLTVNDLNIVSGGNDEGVEVSKRGVAQQDAQKMNQLFNLISQLMKLDHDNNETPVKSSRD